MKRNRKYKISFYFSTLIFLALVTISCGRLDQKTANETFLKKNPTFTLVNSYTGEGWDGVAYHHFEYKKPNDENVYEEIWCFEQQDDGSWKVTSQYFPKE